MSRARGTSTVLPGVRWSFSMSIDEQRRCAACRGPARLARMPRLERVGAGRVRLGSSGGSATASAASVSAIRPASARISGVGSPGGTS